MDTGDHQLIYGLDDRPPLGRLFLYGLQWTLLTLPMLVIATNLTAGFLGYDEIHRIALGQRFALMVGAVMMIQGTFGHRLPLIDGPSGALLLCLATLAPLGEATVRGGMLAGGLALALVAHTGLIGKMKPLFTNNVVGTIIVLIALTIMPFLLPLMLGKSPTWPNGQPVVTLMALSVVFIIPMFSHHLSGFVKTLAVLIGLALGTGLFALTGRVDVSPVGSAPWLSLPTPWPMIMPEVTSVNIIAAGLAYFVVLLNTMGSMAAVRTITGADNMAGRLLRGSAIHGWTGVAAGFMGTYSTTSYAYSPGIILATGVGTRWATVMTGALLFGLGFSQKITAALTIVPTAVVAATMVAAMSSQIGSGIGVLTEKGRTLGTRDYFVVGIPLLLGIMSSLLGTEFKDQLPAWVAPLAGNGLVVGMVGLLLLEHLLLKKK